MGAEGSAARAIRTGSDRLRIRYALNGTGVARLLFYIAVVAASLLVWRIQDGLFSQPYIESQTSDLTPLQEKQLDAFLQMNQLLVTLGTATMGALGLMLGTGRRGTLRGRQLFSAAACAVLAGCSLYFGYLAYQSILWMMQNAFFDLDNPAIQWTRRAHFYTLLLSAFFFADLVIHDLGMEERHERAEPAVAS